METLGISERMAGLSPKTYIVCETIGGKMHGRNSAAAAPAYAGHRRRCAPCSRESNFGHVQKKNAPTTPEAMEPASVVHLVHRKRANVSAGSPFCVQQYHDGVSGAGGGVRNPDGQLGP